MSKWIEVTVHVVERHLVEINDSQTEEWAKKQVADKLNDFDSIDTEQVKANNLDRLLRIIDDNKIIRHGV